MNQYSTYNVGTMREQFIKYTKSLSYINLSNIKVRIKVIRLPLFLLIITTCITIMSISMRSTANEKSNSNIKASIKASYYDSIMQSIHEVAQAAMEESTGTGEIAEKVTSVTDKSIQMGQKMITSLKSSSNLQKEIANFII
ncbi:MAG: hypothetical protein H6Q59_582 [Firmicutes bacterium]|nr:hypothetical protein [Bacillota bacterium]